MYYSSLPGYQLLGMGALPAPATAGSCPANPVAGPGIDVGGGACQYATATGSIICNPGSHLSADGTTCETGSPGALSKMGWAGWLGVLAVAVGLVYFTVRMPGRSRAPGYHSNRRRHRRRRGRRAAFRPALHGARRRWGTSEGTYAPNRRHRRRRIRKSKRRMDRFLARADESTGWDELKKYGYFSRIHERHPYIYSPERYAPNRNPRKRRRAKVMQRRKRREWDSARSYDMARDFDGLTRVPDYYRGRKRNVPQKQHLRHSEGMSARAKKRRRARRAKYAIPGLGRKMVYSRRYGNAQARPPASILTRDMLARNAHRAYHRTMGRNGSVSCPYC